MAPLLLVGAALGGVAMYFLDPEKGRRRRALVRDQAVRAGTEVQEFVEQGTRDLQSRGHAASGRVRSLFRRRQATDKVLVERVRSKMGRHVLHPSSIEVTAASGHVTLSGLVFAHERHDLLDAIVQLPGVVDVIDRLTVFEAAPDITELHAGARGAASNGRWAPGTRLLAALAGSTLALYAFTRESRLTSLTALTGGAALLLRAAANQPLASLAGIDRSHGIEVQKSLYIAAPVDAVYSFLENYDNFPRFMRNVQSVDVLPDGRSHWKVKGPAGTTLEWDSITTRLVKNERIEWSTVEGGPVTHIGAIRLEPVDAGSRVHVRMTYSPPAGMLGHAVARLLGADPKSELDEDMLRLKSALETGRAPRDAAAARASDASVGTHSGARPAA